MRSSAARLRAWRRGALMQVEQRVLELVQVAQHGPGAVPETQLTQSPGRPCAGSAPPCP